jgi:hypothetical protein
MKIPAISMLFNASIPAIFLDRIISSFGFQKVFD